VVLQHVQRAEQLARRGVVRLLALRKATPASLRAIGSLGSERIQLLKLVA
jgi:hypothetical protein